MKMKKVRVLHKMINSMSYINKNKKIENMKSFFKINLF